MIRKNKIIIMSIIGILTVGTIQLGNRIYNYFHNPNNIKVLVYKSADESKGTENLSDTKIIENGYQIDKFENVQGVDWLNDNEIVTLTQKDQDANGNPSYYCSIYNLNTRQSKDYKDVSIGEYLGTSPNKQFVIYAEPRNIPKVESDEWKKALDSGELLHKKVKILNLTTGETKDVKTENENKDAEFKFISDNKILANYFDKWAIVDKEGNICTEGNYNGKKDDAIWIAGTDELKDLGDKVSGKFYYTHEIKKAADGSIGIKVCSMDVDTKEIKDIYEGPYSLKADEGGKTIIMDKYSNNGEKVDGAYKNRTFGYYILDENGNVVQDINAKEGEIPETFAIYSDGSKAAYVQGSNGAIHEDVNKDIFINVVDAKTGKIDEVTNITNIRDKDDENGYLKTEIKDKDGKIQERSMRARSVVRSLEWDKAGTSLMVNYSYFSKKEEKYKADTYIITFDK